MEIRRHPVVAAEQERGRRFEEEIAAIGRRIKSTQIAVSSPGEEFTLVFDADGSVADIEFDDELSDAQFFERFPGSELGEVMTQVCADGYARANEILDAALQAAVDATGQG